ncbi:Protein kinase dsk1 (Dis1-suppressing protein kinase) [Durusdinium trenchii]|uniref:non-specific serine/threonine protein kinase n=1 Tax=Durusdinium trenchii TaxID=1381693 RepID=A0ABP0N6L4_9DINO
MKVQKSAPHYTEAAYDEIELLAEAAKRSKDVNWEETQKGPLKELFPEKNNEGFTGVVQLIDYFEHFGINGKHVCMVFETMGPNVLALIKRYNFKGIPLDIVRKVTTHTLIGLDYLHRICGIIHTDLKPENVLVGCPRGVPVNKTGIPLVGNIDPSMFAKKEQAAGSGGVAEPSVRSRDLRLEAAKFEGTQEDYMKKGGKKKDKDKKFHDEGTDEVGEEEAMPRPPPILAPPSIRGGSVLHVRDKQPRKPFLKPSRSDPTLLSSYGDDSIAMNRPLYNHASSPLAEVVRISGERPNPPSWGIQVWAWAGTMAWFWQMGQKPGST